MNKCKQCGKRTNNEVFCSRSCSATFNNQGVRRHGRPKGNCPICGEEKSNHGKKTCSHACANELKYRTYIKRWLQGKEDGTIGKKTKQTSANVRRYMLEKVNNACEVCGWSMVHPVTGNVPLQLHHKDGNPLNNIEDNLEVLCPNCHVMTDTFGSLNNGNGRDNRPLSGKRNSSHSLTG